MKKNIFITLSTLCIYFLIAVASSSSDKKKESKEEKVSSFLDTLNQSQKDFLALEMKYDTIFDNCKNDLQFSVKADEKDKAQRELFKGEGFSRMGVQNWRGIVDKVLSINGDAGIKIHVMYEPENTITSPGFYLTSESILDDYNLLGKGTIKKSSPIFNTIENIQEGSEIEFSGNFIKSVYSNRLLFTNSQYVNLEQEYLFKITDLKVLKAK